MTKAASGYRDRRVFDDTLPDKNFLRTDHHQSVKHLAQPKCSIRFMQNAAAEWKDVHALMKWQRQPLMMRKSSMMPEPSEVGFEPSPKRYLRRRKSTAPHYTETIDTDHLPIKSRQAEIGRKRKVPLARPIHLKRNTPFSLSPSQEMGHSCGPNAYMVIVPKMRVTTFPPIQISSLIFSTKICPALCNAAP